jgi:hypothetical protein
VFGRDRALEAMKWVCERHNYRSNALLGAFGLEARPYANAKVRSEKDAVSGDDVERVIIT